MAFVRAILGAVAGICLWALMIVVTTGVCSVPVLSVLWCTTPFGSIPTSITFWDLVLLVGMPIAVAAYFVKEEIPGSGNRKSR